MRASLLSTAVLALLCTAAVAQTDPATTTSPAANTEAPANPAVKTDEANNPGAPAAGANSFTEAQARAEIEDAGYTAVSALAKDDAGIWRGQAAMGGKTVRVAVDYQGNVVVE